MDVLAGIDTFLSFGREREAGIQREGCSWHQGRGGVLEWEEGEGHGQCWTLFLTLAKGVEVGVIPSKAQSLAVLLSSQKEDSQGFLLPLTLILDVCPLF